MKNKQKLTIGDSNIASLRFPKTKIKNFKNWGKRFSNTIDKAINGKKLTNNQSQQLVEVHLRAIDFPIVPNLIILQLIEAYQERLENSIKYEFYENASEYRDIIISLKEKVKL